MSANVDAVRAIYERFNKGDIEGVLAALDPDVVWQSPDSLPYGGTFRGVKEVGRFFASLPPYFPELRVEAKEFLESGDVVVALGQHRGRGAAQPFEGIGFAMVWKFRAGKPVSFCEYPDTARVLRAVVKG